MLGPSVHCATVSMANQWERLVGRQTRKCTQIEEEPDEGKVTAKPGGEFPPTDATTRANHEAV
jgi:hypothetical protein